MKIILLVLGVLLVIVVRTQADNLSAESVVMGAGDTKDIAIELNNPTKQYVAFQLDVVLPDGITLAMNNKGNPVVSLDADRVSDHTLNVKELGNNTYRLLSFSMSNATFSGIGGALLHMTLKAASNVSAGRKTSFIKGQTFTDASANQVKWDDESFTINVLSSVTIKVDDKTREYGENNPTWTYSVTGGELYGGGEPALNCEATVTSPVGKYDITVEKGTVANPATLTKGTLTVTKAPLTITAKSYSMKQGDALPTFEVIYEGFKNGESEDVLTTKPTLTTTATSASKPGTYEISLAGATADNYEISYIKGLLTVEAGSFTVTYVINGETYKTVSYDYGATITPEAAPTKEGYTFSGWSWIPSKMPDEDVTITGFFTVNKYKLTYVIDGKVYKEVEMEYGARITPEPQPTGDFVSFSWTGLPETMPARDVTVQADYVTGSIDVQRAKSGTQTGNRYDMGGRKMNGQPKKGVNIIRYQNGTTKKVVMK